MRIVFAGVGEAFDEHLGNTTLLVGAGGRFLLLDCGFTAAHSFWRVCPDPMALSGVCLSHFHGDHYFGLPALLVRFVEEGRTAPLTIVGQPGVEDRVVRLMELAYPGSLGKKRFPVQFLESVPGVNLDVAGFGLSFAVGDHPQPCLGVRVEQGGQSVFFSGDGRPTEATETLARGCGLVVHEAFSLDADIPGHGTVAGALAFARKVGARAVALVHVQRAVRFERRGEIDALLAQTEGVEAFLPEEGAEYLLPGGTN